MCCLATEPVKPANLDTKKKVKIKNRMVNQKTDCYLYVVGGQIHNFSSQLLNNDIV